MRLGCGPPGRGPGVDPGCGCAGEAFPPAEEPLEPPEMEGPLQRAGREELDPRAPQVPQL